jgi:hypothetical protein
MYQMSFLICIMLFSAHFHAAELLILNQQLSALSSPLPTSIAMSLYKKECRHKPRFKRNLGGICYLNAALEIIHIMYCNEEFRTKIIPVSEIAEDKDSSFRRETIKILDAYDNPNITDIVFAEMYDLYAGIIASLELPGFNICGHMGGSALGMIQNIANRLLKSTLADKIIASIEDLENFPIQTLFIRHPKNEPWSFNTIVEQALSEFIPSSLKNLSNPSFTFPPFLLFVYAPALKQQARNAIKNSNIPPILLSFPFIFDIISCINIKEGYLPGALKPVNYRLDAVNTSFATGFLEEHATAIMRDGITWYWSSDDIIMKIDITQMKKIAQNGYMIFYPNSSIEHLEEQQSKGKQFTISETTLEKYFGLTALMPSVLLYERVD